MKKGLKTNRLLVVAGLFLGIVFLYSFFGIETAQAVANNQTVNFQGRLLNAQGATVPDGFYNIEFKIYQDGDGQTAGDTTGSPSGSLKWTEDYLNSASHGVKVVNGYLSVNLGSITPFGSNINWNQGTLWLSMQIGNTSSCTITTSFQANCGGDGEMVPMQPLTSSPYAQNAGLLGGLSSTQFVQLAQGLQTDSSSSTNSIYINKTGTGNIIDLQSAGSDAFTVTNSGDLTFGSNTNHTLSVATAGSGAGNSLTVAAGSGASGSNNGGNLILRGGAATGSGTGGSVIVKPQTDSTAAFQVQNSSGNNVLSVDTSSNSAQGQVVLGQISNNSATLVFASSGGGTITLNTPSIAGGASYALTLPTAAPSGSGQCLQTSSTTQLTFSTCGTPGTFLAKNSTDTSGAAAGTGVLYAFTNSSSASTGGVLSLDNGTNTGSTLSATTAGNPAAGKAVIYGQDTNAGPSGNLIDLEAGSTPSSKFSVNASGDITNASNKINTDTLSGSTLTFGAASTASVQSATSQALTITANASSAWSVGGTNQNLTIQTSGTGTLALDTAGAGTANFGNTNATTIGIGGASGAVTTIGGGNVAHTVHIADGGTSTIQAVTIGSTGSTSSVLIQAGTGNLSIQTQGGTLGVGNNTVAQALQIGNTTGATGLTENVGTGNYVLNGVAGSTYAIGAATTTGTITIGGTAQTGNMVIGSSSGTNTLAVANGSGATTVNIANNQTAGSVNIGAAMTTGTITIGGTGAQTGAINVGTGTGAQSLNFGTGGTGAKTVIIGSQASSSATTIDAGTGAINIGTSASARSTNIATGGAAQTVTVGSTNGTSSLLLQSGTGNLSLQTQGTGTLGVGTNAVAQIIQVGNTTGATSLTENVGTGNYVLNGVTSSTYTIGGATTTGTITIGGTAQTGNMVLGSSSGTNTLAIANGTGATTVNIANNQAAGAVSIGAAMTTGTITIGGTAQTGTQTFGQSTANNTINIGDANTTAGNTQTINIGAGTGVTSGKSAVTIGSSANASSLLLQSGTGNVQLATSGITRATFDTSNNVFFGNGITAASPNNFTISGTGSSTTAVTGGTVTLQGGSATVGSANGGNLTLSGGTGIGTGVNGLVVLTTPTYQTASAQTCSSNCTITQANIDSDGSVVINSTGTGVVVTMPSPTITTAGRVIYVTAANGSNDFTLRVNVGGAGDVAMRQNTTATMIWNGSAWTAAGASSSTTLQAAYDNTLTSAGGAELVVSNTSNHNGLTIRDSGTSPVNGTLLEVQSANAAELFSVNGAVTDYANNGGSENTYGSEWAGFGTGGSVSRNTNSTYIANGTGSAGISTTGTANTGAKNVLTSTLTANLQYNVSFAAKLTAGSASFTDLEVYYSKTGSATDVACTNYSTTTIPTSVWTKVNCTFTAPSSGETSTNALLILGTAGATRTFYVDNVSVTVGASQNYATDGGVDNSGSFSTNWPALGTATTSWDNTTGNDTSDSAKVVTAASTNQGVKNVLSITPQNTTLYLISVYAKLNSGTFTNFSIGYSPDDGGVAGGNFKACVDYNTQTVTTTGFTQITCYVTTGSATASAPRVYFYQPTATARTFWVDTFSMTLASNAVPNVQIGGGTSGGPVTLLTLDSAASAPIAANNQSLLGSMYYDTTLGKLQCYESDGWGACGASPDNIVTLSPEYTNAVLHGPSGGTVGVGTMTSDFCSDALNINDGSSGQPTICNANETRNFYKWTSPQATAQTYAIYVTYQLPQTFKGFTSGRTSLSGFTDSSNSSVAYKVYDAKVSGLTQCGSSISVSSGVQTVWQTATATGAADPSTCGFTAGDSVLFEIDVTASNNANAYVGNLGFTFSNQ